MIRRHCWNRRRVLGALAALPVARLAAAADIDAKRTGGPYVPTPQVVVDEMLRLGRVGPEDFVIDLGSGDGVIVLTAAQKLKARGMGVEIDPELVLLANNEAKRRGIADRAVFQVQDVFKADLGKATVVTLYLLPGMMMNLRPKIYSELRPGARVVSHDYHFDDWQPDDQYTWDVPEKEAINGVPRATVYLWIVPAKVAGRWQVKVTGSGAAEEYELTLRQRFQELDGTDSRGARVIAARLRGGDIMFSLPGSGGRNIYRGRVTGDAMEGAVERAGGKGTARFSATRVKP
ncbi:MAG: methyltransferase domain-containing protein [Burkholderiales bacterium]|nr:methyltransferase domain-containing protein [Burkholderiales bacterium]